MNGRMGQIPFDTMYGKFEILEGHFRNGTIGLGTIAQSRIRTPRTIIHLKVNIPKIRFSLFWLIYSAP